MQNLRKIFKVGVFEAIEIPQTEDIIDPVVQEALQNIYDEVVGCYVLGAWVNGIDENQKYLRCEIKTNPDHPRVVITPVNMEQKKMGIFYIYPYLKGVSLRYEITSSCPIGKEQTIYDLPKDDYDYIHDFLCKIHETSKALAVQTKKQ